MFSIESKIFLQCLPKEPCNLELPKPAQMLDHQFRIRVGKPISETEGINLLFYLLQ